MPLHNAPWLVNVHGSPAGVVGVQLPATRVATVFDQKPPALIPLSGLLVTSWKPKMKVSAPSAMLMWPSPQVTERHTTSSRVVAPEGAPVTGSSSTLQYLNAAARGFLQCGSVELAVFFGSKVHFWVGLATVGQMPLPWPIAPP
jgi:hypothetical protein